MKGKEDRCEDNGEVYGTFPDEPVSLRLEGLQAKPSNREKERRDWVCSEDLEDDGYEDYNGVLYNLLIYSFVHLNITGRLIDVAV